MYTYMTLQEVGRGNVPTSHVVPHRECVLGMSALLQFWMKMPVTFVLAKHILCPKSHTIRVCTILMNNWLGWPTFLVPVVLTCGKSHPSNYFYLSAFWQLLSFIRLMGQEGGPWLHTSVLANCSCNLSTTQNFHLLFHEYCIFRHNAHLTYCLLHIF